MRRDGTNTDDEKMKIPGKIMADIALGGEKRMTIELRSGTGTEAWTKIETVDTARSTGLKGTRSPDGIEPRTRNKRTGRPEGAKTTILAVTATAITEIVQTTAGSRSLRETVVKTGVTTD